MPSIINDNPYLPVPAKVESTYFESDDRTLKTLTFSFLDTSLREKFNFLPGQFIELSILGKGESPFGIASNPNEELIKITVNRTGYVTKAIHNLSKGDIVGIRGPLGNWFPISKFVGSNLAIISGGFAFTTLASLTDYLLENYSDKLGKIYLIYGARNPGMLLYRDKLKEWSNNPRLETYITIDNKVNGWDGLTGFVPDIVEKTDIDIQNTYTVICGPPIMIKLTIPKLLNKGIRKDYIYTSLERRMKCGIGKCGRCNIGKNFVCKDGPVFNYADLEGLPEEY